MRLRKLFVPICLALSAFIATDSLRADMKFNFFPFCSPTIGIGNSERDPSVYEKMNYYGFSSGTQTTLWFMSDGLDDVKSLLKSATIYTYDTYAQAAVDSFVSFLETHPTFLPPATNRFESMYDKFFMPWNGNIIYCYIIDSLMTNFNGTATQKRNKAVEVVVNSIAAADAFFRDRYDCDTIIHQVCEEAWTQWQDTVSNYFYHSNFLDYTNGDSVAAYRLFLSVLHQIEGGVKSEIEESILTAVEVGWLGISGIQLAFESEFVDSLDDTDIIFFQSQSTYPRFKLEQANALGSSRLIGARCDRNDNPGLSDQYEDLTDAYSIFTNADYLTFFPGGNLDGRDHGGVTVGQNVDAASTFKAFSQWLDKDYLHVVDKFHETYIDTVQWTKVGTVTGNSDSTATLSPGGSLQSKTSFGTTTTRARIKRATGELSSTQELGLYMTGTEFVKLYMKADTAYTVIKVDGSAPVTTKHGAFGTITPNVYHEFKILVDGEVAVFHIDGNYVTDENFNVDPDLQLKVYSGSGTRNLVADSVSVIDQYAATPQITITNEVVSDTGNKATAVCSFTLSEPASVIANLKKGYASQDAQSDSVRRVYTSNGYVSYGSVTGVVTTSDPNGWYHLMVRASNAAGTDSASTNSFYFYWNDTTLTILAGEDEPLALTAPQLPKSFSLAQNHPNPFNPSTSISYSIPESIAPLAVKLVIYNSRGQLLARLINGEKQSPGSYTVNWDGKDLYGRKVSSGIYFYRFTAGDFTSTRKMVLIK